MRKVDTRKHPLYCITYHHHQHILDKARLSSGRLGHSRLFNQPAGILLLAEYIATSKAYECNRGH